jgi:hypothetical protein
VIDQHDLDVIAEDRDWVIDLNGRRSCRRAGDGFGPARAVVALSTATGVALAPVLARVMKRCCCMKYSSCSWPVQLAQKKMKA